MPLKKYNKNVNQFTKGLVGLGVGGLVTARLDSQMPAGTPSLSQGINTAAGFTPIIGTAIGGKAALSIVKGYEKKTKKKKKYY